MFKLCNFWRQNIGKNVDEIDHCCQYHQHFMSSFGADILLPKNYRAKL